jgi:hypothetical protein
MITLYPSIKKINLLIIAVCLINITHAQQASYASAEINSSRRTVAFTETVVKIKTRSENKVVLGWAPFKGDVSHYVLERSINGRAFYEAGILFTGDGENEPEYIFTDHLKMNYGGTLYYRLHVVGLDGSEIFTPVTTVNGGGANLLTH